MTARAHSPHGARSAVVYARVEPDLLDQIQELADFEDRSLSYTVRRLLVNALDVKDSGEKVGSMPDSRALSKNQDRHVINIITGI